MAPARVRDSWLPAQRRLRLPQEPGHLGLCTEVVVGLGDLHPADPYAETPPSHGGEQILIGGVISQRDGEGTSEAPHEVEGGGAFVPWNLRQDVPDLVAGAPPDGQVGRLDLQ